MPILAQVREQRWPVARPELSHGEGRRGDAWEKGVERASSRCAEQQGLVKGARDAWGHRLSPNPPLSARSREPGTRGECLTRSIATTDLLPPR